MRHGSRSARLLLSIEVDCCVAVEALEFNFFFGPFLVPAPCDVLWFVSEFVLLWVCSPPRASFFVWTDDSVVDAHSRSPHESCVDLHLGYSCRCVAVFRCILKHS